MFVKRIADNDNLYFLIPILFLNNASRSTKKTVDLLYFNSILATVFDMYAIC